MALRFIRKPSATPNIQNTDDIRMTRYAYGNQSGYVKGYGSELGYTKGGGIFVITSGIFVIQGAEVEIDANGWGVDVSGVATKRYYTVYGEVNLALQTADVKSTYDTATYPVIAAGDDLTQNISGTARLPLYRFTVTSGVIADESKQVTAISYISDLIAKEVADRNAAIATEATARASADTQIRADLENGTLKPTQSITQSQNNNNTLIATTAFVVAALNNIKARAGTITFTGSLSNYASSLIVHQNLVLLRIHGFVPNNTGSGTVLATMEAGFRPNSQVTGRTTGKDDISFTVDTNGQLKLTGNVGSSGGGSYIFDITYLSY